MTNDSGRVEARTGGRQWVLERGDIDAPLYLGVDGTWSSSLGRTTTWFIDRESAEGVRPNGATAARATRIEWTFQPTAPNRAQP